MDITIKEIKLNQSFIISIDGKTLFIKRYYLYRLSCPYTNSELTIDTIQKIYKSLKAKNLKEFNSLNNIHRSLPIKLSVHFWYEDFLDLISFHIKKGYPEKLPNIKMNDLSKNVFEKIYCEITKQDFIVKDIQGIVLKLLYSWLVSSAEKGNIEEFKRIIKHFSYLKREVKIPEDILKDLIEKVVRRDIEEFREPTGFSLFRRIFPPQSKNRGWERELCERMALHFRPLYVSKIKDKTINFENDIWTFYIHKELAALKRRFDFSTVEEPLRQDIKKYFYHLLTENGEELSTLQGKLNNCKSFILHLQGKSNNKGCVESSYLYSYLLANISEIKYAPHLTVIKAELEDHFSLGSIKQIFISMAGFFQWYIREYNLKISNPFHKVKIRNLNSYTTHIQEIPQEIIDTIHENFNCLSPMLQNAWIILMNTGMRVSELINLKQDWLYFDQLNEQYQLKYIPLKQEKERRIKQKGVFHHIYATPAVVTAFKSQLEISKEIRKETELDSLFIHKDFKTRLMSTNALSHALNKILIDKGVNFKFSNHMCRKSLIVKLLTEGHSVEEIQKLTGQSRQTVLQYYFGIEEKKIVEMESAFFDEAFDHLFKPNFQKELSVNELEAIRMEIKQGSRKAPNGNGYCGKHIVFGPCVKSRCVGCHLLITTPEQIPLYQQLKVEQELYLSSLEKQFINMGITREEYMTFRDYQAEMDYLRLIEEGLDKLITFVKEKLPIHEQSVYVK